MPSQVLFKPSSMDRAERLLRLFANDILAGKNPSERCLSAYHGDEKITLKESSWAYREAARLVLQQLDGDY